METLEYNVTYQNNSFIVDIMQTEDGYAIAIIHTEGPDNSRSTYIGIAKFCLVHDRYNITVLDGQEETFNITERLINRIIEG